MYNVIEVGVYMIYKNIKYLKLHVIIFLEFNLGCNFSL